MLCYQEHVGPLLGEDFAAMAAWSSLADALPPIAGCSFVFSSGCFGTVALSYLQATITLMYLLLQVQFGWIIVLRAVGVSFFLFLLFICFVQGHLSMAW